jgi:hypothetical protein
VAQAFHRQKASPAVRIHHRPRVRPVALAALALVVSAAVRHSFFTTIGFPKTDLRPIFQILSKAHTIQYPIFAPSPDCLHPLLTPDKDYRTLYMCPILVTPGPLLLYSDLPDN